MPFTKNGSDWVDAAPTVLSMNSEPPSVADVPVECGAPAPLWP
jgi:hypothetical protein